MRAHHAFLLAMLACANQARADSIPVPGSPYASFSGISTPTVTLDVSFEPFDRTLGKLTEVTVPIQWTGGASLAFDAVAGQYSQAVLMAIHLESPNGGTLGSAFAIVGGSQLTVDRDGPAVLTEGDSRQMNIIITGEKNLHWFTNRNKVQTITGVFDGFLVGVPDLPGIEAFPCPTAKTIRCAHADTIFGGMAVGGIPFSPTYTYTPNTRLEGATNAVPEPASCLILCVGGIVVGVARSRMVERNRTLRAEA